VEEIPSTVSYKPHYFSSQRNSNNIFSSFISNISSIKHCPAIQGLYSTGILIKAWCDIKIFVSPEGYVDSIQKEDRINRQKLAGSFHPYSQRAGFLSNMAHWKIHNPWIFNTNRYRKFFWNGAYWWNPQLIENNIHIVPGFIDFYTQHGTEINMFLPIKNESYEIHINCGDPLIHLFPIDDNSINIKTQLISAEKLDSFNNSHLKWVGSAYQVKSKKLKNNHIY